MHSEIDPFPTQEKQERTEAKPASIPPGLHAGMLVANKYELTRKVGTGAMGEVWAAKHLTLDEEVAIKLVKRDVEHGDGTNAEDRFLLEARVSAALARKTRHIVNVTDHGEDGPLAYLVMELLDGESLDVRLARKGPLSLAKVVPIIAQIARGLAVAHAEGIVHRDLKPSNIFVTKDEHGNALVKVLDFGIAKLRASMRKIPVNQTPAVQGGAKHATMHGFLLGTPAFMSPEQAKGKTNVDHRADVWALGVIAYHLLTGQYPFDGANFEELLERLCRVRYTSILKHRPDLPDVVADFFARAFASRIDQRFQSAVAFAGAFEQLEPLAQGLSPSLAPPRPASSSKPDRDPEPVVDPGSMVAAGIPPKGRIWLRLAGAALVATVLAGTAALVSLNYEREQPASAAKLTAGANIADSVNGTTTLTGAARDAIPLPSEVQTTTAITARDLPAAAKTSPPAAITQRSTSASPPAIDTSSFYQPSTPLRPATPAKPKGPHDKSEVF